MLHHVPSVEQQNALLAEMHRVLRPGGVFVGTDSLDGPDFRQLHTGDICVPIDPAGLADRLADVGNIDVQVDINDYAIRFRGRK